MKSTSEIFCDNLKRLRKAKFPTQEDFAPLVNLSTRGYQKYETGETSPTPQVLDRFAKKLGCEPWEFIADNTEAISRVLSLKDAAVFLSKYASLSPKLQRVVWALVFEDPKLYAQFPAMKRVVE